MAYATVAQLAEALEMRVTAENTAMLQDCLDAAAAEIDHFFEDGVWTEPAPALVVRTNVNRGVEWFKAKDTFNGGVGFEATGVLAAPVSGFERHAAALLPYRVDWGVA